MSRSIDTEPTVRALLALARGHRKTDVAEGRARSTSTLERAKIAYSWLTTQASPANLTLDEDAVHRLVCALAAEVASGGNVLPGANLDDEVLGLTDGRTVDVCEAWPVVSKAGA